MDGYFWVCRSVCGGFRKRECFDECAVDEPQTEAQSEGNRRNHHIFECVGIKSRRNDVELLAAAASVEVV